MGCCALLIWHVSHVASPDMSTPSSPLEMPAVFLSSSSQVWPDCWCQRCALVWWGIEAILDAAFWFNLPIFRGSVYFTSFLRWSLALSLYGQLCWHLNNTCYSKSGMMLAMLIDLLSEMLFENGLTREYTQAELAWNPPFQSMQCLAS